MKNVVALVIFLAVTFIVPALGVFSPPGEWYASLNKPSWNPPSWIFGPVWTPLFFGLKMPGLAFAEIVLLCAAIIATALAFHRASTVAAMLLVPYAAWVGFASFLNFTLWRLNP